VDQKDSDAGRSGNLSPEDYQRMNEKEKDAEITRAIIRLQSKIQKILYLTEAEKAGKESIKTQKQREENSQKKKG
jgi:hypothetical protein